MLPQLRPDSPLDRGHLRCEVFFQWCQGPAQTPWRQLPQGKRLLVESRPGQTARLRQEDCPAPTRVETPGLATNTTLLRRCLSSDLGPGPGVLLLVAGRPAV